MNRVVGIPRPKPGPAQLVVQLGAGEMLDGVILSHAIWGVGTHWNDRAGKHGRSERCTRDKGECSACNGALPYRWKGYVYVFDLIRKRTCFVELTPNVAEQIELRAPANETLRGKRLVLHRGDGGKKTRIRVDVADYRGDLSTLPEDRDPETILETLWNWGR